MARETNEERIVALLLCRPELDDDEISQSTGITPRQQVNQICRDHRWRGTAGLALICRKLVRAGTVG